METYTVQVYGGTREWYQNDKLHRLDGPAIEFADGTRYWYQNGQRHRTDGPAVECADGTRYWYKNNLLHRTDGPAIEFASGDREWRIEGKPLTEEQFNQRTQKTACEDKQVIIDGVAYRLVKV